jgi:hypothetical protein
MCRYSSPLWRHFAYYLGGFSKLDLEEAVDCGEPLNTHHSSSSVEVQIRLDGVDSDDRKEEHFCVISQEISGRHSVIDLPINAASREPTRMHFLAQMLRAGGVSAIRPTDMMQPSRL